MPGHFQGRPADAPSHDACWAACAAGVSGGGVDQAYDGWRVVSQFEFQQWVEAVEKRRCVIGGLLAGWRFSIVGFRRTC